MTLLRARIGASLLRLAGTSAGAGVQELGDEPDRRGSPHGAVCVAACLALRWSRCVAGARGSRAARMAGQACPQISQAYPVMQPALRTAVFLADRLPGSQAAGSRSPCGRCCAIGFTGPRPTVYPPGFSILTPIDRQGARTLIRLPVKCVGPCGMKFGLPAG